MNKLKYISDDVVMIVVDKGAFPIYDNSMDFVQVLVQEPDFTVNFNPLFFSSTKVVGLLNLAVFGLSTSTLTDGQVLAGTYYPYDGDVLQNAESISVTYQGQINEAQNLNFQNVLDAIAQLPDADAIAASVESQLINDATGEAFKQSLLNKLEGMDVDSINLSAIASAVAASVLVNPANKLNTGPSGAVVADGLILGRSA